MRRAARYAWSVPVAALLLGAPLSPLAPGGAAAQGVSVAFSPTHQIVGAGSGFDVQLVVTAAGAGFNGFDARVRFDTSRVALDPASPISSQQGSYMTGACGMTFHQFTSGADSCDATDVLLCNGVSLTGPGQIYKLHFTALDAPNTTTILHLENVRFYDAGVLVMPVIAQDDTVEIDNAVGVGDGPPGVGVGVEVRAAPNPATHGTTFLLAAPRAGAQSLLVQNVAGRVVRHLDAGSYGAGARSVAWDGADDAGRAVPTGVYLARYATPDGARLTRVIVLR